MVEPRPRARFFVSRSEVDCIIHTSPYCGPLLAQLHPVHPIARISLEFYQKIVVIVLIMLQ